MKNKLPTLSFGIPAYNEEGNISYLIKSIIKQKRNIYKLEKIFVICDGCTDDTISIVTKLAKKYKFIKLIDRKIRSGKPNALNLIYKLNKSDYILTIDADVIFEKNSDVENMVREIIKDPKLNLVGPRHIPISSSTLMGKFAIISYLSFEEAFLKLNYGNNFYAVMGAYLLRKSFSKAIKYPPNAQADQTILYGLATKKNKNAFKLVTESRVLFRVVDTFHDWRLLGVRSVIKDKANTVKILGKGVLKDYYMPRKLYILALIKWFIKSPFYTFGSIIMNIYIRKFPLKSKMPKGGIWETTKSSKAGIKAYEI